jgi:acyl-CoA synthetase (AMP-forming)/AMP-acid ligase II
MAFEMTRTPESNFAGRLVQRLGASSYLIDAATDETICPTDLPRLVSGVGARLLSAGLKQGDRILIGCRLSPSSGIAYLGAMYAGLIPVPVEEATLVASGDLFLRGSSARAIWTERSLRFDWGRDTNVLFLHGHPRETPAGLNPPAACNEDDLAVLVATSGSTGVPRFVLTSHANLTANTEAIIRSQHLAADERAMLILPLSYCFGASVLHTHLYQGGGIVFDRRFMFPDRVLRAIERYGCTTFAGVPTIYNILLRRSNIRSIPMPSLRRFLQAGGALAPPRIREMQAIVPAAAFYVMYGQTEATARISCLDPARFDVKSGSAGRPLDNLTVRTVDEDGRDVPVGEVGEILVRGPSISKGYFNDPEESRRIFREGWLWTGDLGRLDDDGYLWIDGRKRAFLKLRGVRVSFGEVEARVAAIPGVYECAAAATPHEEAGEALVLWIVPEQGVRNVVERVRSSLPAHWTCQSIQVVSDLPKTSTGKICLSSLRAT